jgi:hypothetical protein
MPNTPATAERGIELIRQSLEREQVFAGVGLDISSVPTSHTSIRFDVHVISGSRSQLILSIEQDLTVLTSQGGLELSDEDGFGLGD